MTPARRTPRRPRRTYHHGDLHRALLDEALATIRTDGVDAITLRELGARVGVSRTALYRHFADKNALLTSVATEGFRLLRTALTDAWETGGRTQTAFRAQGMAYLRFAVSNPSHYRVMFGTAIVEKTADSELAMEAQRAFRVLVDALTSLRDAGVVRADDTLLMATHVWALVHGLAMLLIDDRLPGPIAAERAMRYAIDTLLTGITPPRATR